MPSSLNLKESLISNCFNLKQHFFHTRFTSLTASSTNVLKMLPNPGTPANVIAFHPYNPKIVVAGNNHIKMWDIREGKFSV